MYPWFIGSAHNQIDGAFGGLLARCGLIVVNLSSTFSLMLVSNYVDTSPYYHDDLIYKLSHYLTVIASVVAEVCVLMQLLSTSPCRIQDGITRF